MCMCFACSGSNQSSRRASASTAICNMKTEYHHQDLICIKLCKIEALQKSCTKIVLQHLNYINTNCNNTIYT